MLWESAYGHRWRIYRVVRITTATMKLNQYELSIIGLIIIMFLAFGYYIQPNEKPTPQKIFENKIERAETYYDEAKAISLSMPLLNDTIIKTYGDSLFLMLITLNHDWVIYVKTQEDFEEYTEEIEKMNKKLDELRLKYHHELFMRDLDRTIKRGKELQRKWDKEIDKYETEGTSKFVTS